MSKSQFEKRKNKDAEKPTVVFDNEALDIAVTGNDYKIVRIAYNSTTGEAEVTSAQPVSRMIGLSFLARKLALRIVTKLKE